MYVDEEKLIAANAALKTFAPNTTIVRRQFGWAIEWLDYRGNLHSRRWQTIGGNGFYPAWYAKWDHGGTACTALSQLVRWLQCKDILPLGTWQYWASDAIKLGDLSTVEILERSGWPTVVHCIKCGEAILSGDLDWYSLKGRSGPGHRHGSKNCKVSPKEE